MRRLLQAIHPSNWLILGVLTLAGCAQFTTSDGELKDLELTAEGQGDAYIDCVIGEAQQYQTGSADAAFIFDVAKDNCKAMRDNYISAQSEYLGAQYMMINRPLEESLEQLDNRARSEVAELAKTSVAPAAPLAVSTGSAAAAGASATSGSAGATAPPGGSSAAAPAGSSVAIGAAHSWNPKQRVYLDCMEDQGKKYALVNESAEVIAEVAQSRCSSYMGGANAALAQEGRAAVMGIVLDARIERQPGPAR